jgi:hypothetical protein
MALKDVLEERKYARSRLWREDLIQLNDGINGTWNGILIFN